MNLNIEVKIGSRTEYRDLRLACSFVHPLYQTVLFGAYCLFADKYFCLSVFLSVTFVHCAADIEWFFASDSVSLTDGVKIWLTSVNLSTPNFAPNWSILCLFERRRHLMAIAVEWLEIAQWWQWRVYIGNHHRCFESYDDSNLIRPPLPHTWMGGGSKCTSKTNFAMRAATWRVW